jgi:hypothetical protein
MRSGECRSHPSWVTMLREHVQEHGTAPDGRLFQTYRGGIFLPSTLWHVLQKARMQVFTPAQPASPLIRRPAPIPDGFPGWLLNDRLMIAIWFLDLRSSCLLGSAA